MTRVISWTGDTARRERHTLTMKFYPVWYQWGFNENYCKIYWSAWSFMIHSKDKTNKFNKIKCITHPHPHHDCHQTKATWCRTRTQQQSWAAHTTHTIIVNRLKHLQMMLEISEELFDDLLMVLEFVKQTKHNNTTAQKRQINIPHYISDNQNQ